MDWKEWLILKFEAIGNEIKVQVGYMNSNVYACCHKQGAQSESRNKRNF